MGWQWAYDVPIGIAVEEAFGVWSNSCCIPKQGNYNLLAVAGLAHMKDQAYKQDLCIFFVIFYKGRPTIHGT